MSEDVLQERSGMRECEETKMGKGVVNKRHEKGNKARRNIKYELNGKQKLFVQCSWQRDEQ